MATRGHLSPRLGVLGSGTCVPSASRYPASYLVQPEIDAGGWLLDIGAGSLQRLAQLGVSYFSLQAVFVSHAHPDHIGGLSSLFQALNFTPGFSRKDRLTIYGPASVGDYIELHLRFTPGLRPVFPYRFVVVEEQSELHTEGCHILAKELRHSAPTIGFRFDFGSCVLAYGADTEPCDAIVELGSKSDLLILEASYPKSKPCAGHLTTFQAGQIAHAAGARAVLLTHLYPEVASMDRAEREDQVREGGFTGQLIIAEDLLTLQIGS